MNTQQVREVLEIGILPRFLRIEAPLLDELLDAFAAWPDIPGAEHDAHEDNPALSVALGLIPFLSHQIEQYASQAAQQQHRYAAFMHRYAGSATREEQQRYILDYAGELGASQRELIEDKKAFSRWFDLDAVKDRYGKRLSETDRHLTFVLQRLGAVAAFALQAANNEDSCRKWWRRFAIEEVVQPLLAYEGDTRVVMAAFACLTTALQGMPSSLRQDSMSDTTLHYIYRSALESRHATGIQCAALELLPGLSMESFAIALRQRLQQPLDGDDIFVRRTAVALLARYLMEGEEFASLLSLAVQDRSPYVRQGLAAALCRYWTEGGKVCLEQLALHDDAAQVRARAVLGIVRDVLDAAQRPWILKVLKGVLDEDRNAYVLRVCMHVLPDMFQRLVDEQTEASELKQWQQQIFATLNRLHRQAEAVAIRRYAAQCAERIWVCCDATARALLLRLGEEMTKVRPGFSKAFARSRLSDAEKAVLGRVLSVIGQQDFGFDVREGRFRYHITRGHVFEFRFWRFLYEMRHPSPDKRQAFPHLIGRSFKGTLRAPSSILAEVTPTKVPGEPLMIEEEGGWRPYLPLVDEVISCLNYGLIARPIRIYSSEGVTLMKPPRSLLRRYWSLLLLNVRFEHYARLRNWDHDEQSAADAYVRALEDLGFTIEHSPHDYPEIGTFHADPAVTRFFPVLLPLDSDIWTRFTDYMLSAYENTLFDLLLFTSIAIVLFFGRHLYISRSIRKARQSIPLVIGGWGTRGKSGVERLKAAMFNGLGYGLVSKTTGCEAMFLHADAFRQLRELFLFRPYDKASIWEQADLLRMSRNMKPDVFLWECMGLSPHYVRVLQHGWMRDDIATITNTFPDHENLQGPAGINIPEVMCDFIPRDGSLLTSEEQMLPVLREKTKEYGTPLTHVGWLEAGLLTEDILQRFPYAEHPYNIALVLALAKEMGVDEDRALKMMADHIVPDIGVLKRFPAAPVQGRTLEFVNGMSANERYGCLQNWRRMGFDQPPQSGEWISTLVNNRADRVSRSRVFAELIVRDISVDRHFLIGTNLHGLTGYIQQAWNDYAAHLTLFPEGDGKTLNHALDTLRKGAVRMRVAVDQQQLRDALRIMLQALNGDIDVPMSCWHDVERLKTSLDGMDAASVATVIRHYEPMLQQYHAYMAFAQRIQHQGVDAHAQLDEEYRRLLEGWFNARLIVIEDAHATGEQIIHHIVEATPPGFMHRLMGMQNIKGTGLDFVYRWQDWERCYQACEKLKDEDPYIVGSGLNELTSFQNYGQLSEKWVRQSIEEVRHSKLGSRQRFQAELNVILTALDTAMKEVRLQLQHEHHRGLLERFIDGIEAFVDAGDAVSRRKTANRIYRDLVAERISHERAANELRKLTQRQKGGWLLDNLYALRDYLKREKEED